MSKIRVTAKPDFLESLTHAKPLDSLAEIIWNGFDAGANRVQVHLELNDLDGIESIKVSDDGYGIDRAQVENFFGNLGESWKKAKHRQGDRALHGKNGKGRFKAFSLGEKIEWKTNFKLDGKIYSYKIKGNAQTLDDFDISDPVQSQLAAGTEVTFYNLRKDFRSLREDNAQQELSKKFAAYLTEYPSLRLEYSGTVIDPLLAQNHQGNYSLGDIPLADGRSANATLSIIEWNIPTDRVIHLCDAEGISLSEVPAGQAIRAPNFNFTAYIKSEYFRELDSTNQLALVNLHADTQTILKVAKNKIKEHFRIQQLKKQGMVVDRWKKERIYPYEDKEGLSSIEVIERQVFDILAVNVESFLPSFEDADEQSKRFTFRLLSQAIKENPNSVQEIIGEVLGLKKSDQDDLALLLKKTPLSSIISSAKIVANRLDFINGLETLLFDKENKKKLLERDQLHKILENESWLFSEDFALSGSELRLEEVLNKHLEKLGKREDDPMPVTVGEDKTGRVDLFFHKANQPRAGEYDYLVVELKRPSQKIDSDVITQIKKYANAVANDERFRDVPTRWTFVAVSNDFDSYAKSEATQRDRPKGLVHDNAEQNIRVWIKSWGEIINDAKARLHFLSKQLSYEADQDSAKAYLNQAHSKFIPLNMLNEIDDNDGSRNAESN